ncbi:hypothetical protein K438DRAFT_1836115, partial [Mycena galopus ATCC 62051]
MRRERTGRRFEIVVGIQNGHWPEEPAAYRCWESLAPPSFDDNAASIISSWSLPMLRTSAPRMLPFRRGCVSSEIRVGEKNVETHTWSRIVGRVREHGTCSLGLGQVCGGVGSLRAIQLGTWERASTKDTGELRVHAKTNAIQ